MITSARRGSRLDEKGFLPRRLRPGHVLRKLQKADPRLLRLHHLEGLAYHLGHHRRGPKLGGVLGDGPEEVHQVQVLVALLVHPGGGRLSGHRHHGRAVHVGVRHARHEVGRPRTQGGQADARPSGEPAVNVRHERGSLLVAGGDEVHLAVQHHVHHVEVLLAGEAEDPLDPLVLETADEELRRVHSGAPETLKTTRSTSSWGQRAGVSRRLADGPDHPEWPGSIQASSDAPG